eukprot:5752120-Alexandrium_andersonii.AAC.1
MRMRKNLGHCSNRTLRTILARKGAHARVLKLCLELECHACQANVAASWVRKAAGIETPESLQVLGTDGFEWVDPRNGHRRLMTIA